MKFLFVFAFLCLVAVCYAGKPLGHKKRSVVGYVFRGKRDAQEWHPFKLDKRSVALPLFRREKRDAKKWNQFIDKRSVALPLFTREKRDAKKWNQFIDKRSVEVARDRNGIDW